MKAEIIYANNYKIDGNYSIHIIHNDKYIAQLGYNSHSKPELQELADKFNKTLSEHDKQLLDNYSDFLLENGYMSSGAYDKTAIDKYLNLNK